MILDGKVPPGPLAEKWDNRRRELTLINPANRSRYRIIVVGTGLAGASAAATLGELGYRVEAFCTQDTPRRGHSIAAQGGINAAKNYSNDGDSIFRLFYDTIKGGDFRAREGNVYRLAMISNSIIDQCVAQGVPFARDYAGYLENRSFGGAQVSRTFYARGQTGQQLLLGAYSALMRQVKAGNVTIHPRTEMLDLVLVDGEAKGITIRHLVTGQISACTGDAVCLCTGGYANIFYLSTNAMSSNVTASYRAYKRGAFFANPCFTQIHPTCIPVSGEYQSKLTLMSESLRNDGRVWVPREKEDRRPPHEIPEDDRDYFLERKYPGFGNLAPRDIASRSVKEVCDEGHGVGDRGQGVYLDFSGAIKRLGEHVIRERYGNLFDMYEKITAESALTGPMRIYPAPHYTMGGLWVDYNLQSNIRGLFVLGEANFSDHGANRLGASALMQGLADGYFILPGTISDYLSEIIPGKVTGTHPEFERSREEIERTMSTLLSIQGTRTVNDFHRELGRILWDHAGMVRSEESLKKALKIIPELRARFWEDVRVPGKMTELNQELEKAGRVADFLEFGELMVLDALYRNESCGGHFRIEHQSADGEARRDDENFCHVVAWEFRGQDKEPEMHREPLTFEHVAPVIRGYR